MPSNLREGSVKAPPRSAGGPTTVNIDIDRHHAGRRVEITDVSACGPSGAS
jgi:hypothetical protein